MVPNRKVEQVLADHLALKTVFSRIQEEFDRPIVCTRVLHALLVEALSSVTVRFQQEEQNGGNFDQVLARRPSLADQVQELIKQHGEFRERLAAIAGKLASSSEETLFDLSREFDSFLADYCRHEARENKLARQNFERDHL